MREGRVDIIKLFRKCPICDGSEGKELLKLSFEFPEGNPLPRNSRVVSCANCGFTFADVNASQKEYNEYYDGFNMYAECEELRGQTVQIPVGYIEGERLISEKVEKNAKIIDIGCGGGGFLHYLQSEGYTNLVGYDPSKSSIEKLHNISVGGIVGNIFDSIPKELENGFDVVISTMVIEHIYDLNGYISQILKFLRQDRKSYVLLSAPAVEGFNKYMCPRANYFNHEHINYFTETSASNMLNKYNLQRINDDPYFVDSGEKILLMICESGDVKKGICKDNEAERIILDYLRKDDLTEINNTIKNVVNANKKVVVWGIGSWAIQVLSEHSELLEYIEYIVDNNTTKQGTLFGEKIICSPDKLLEDENDYLILICSMKNSLDIEKQIKDMNLDNEVVVIGR